MGLFHVLRKDVSGSAPMARMLGGAGSALDGRVGSVMLLRVNARMLIPVAASADSRSPEVRYDEMIYTMDERWWITWCSVAVRTRCANGPAGSSPSWNAPLATKRNRITSE